MGEFTSVIPAPAGSSCPLVFKLDQEEIVTELSSLPALSEEQIENTLRHRLENLVSAEIRSWNLVSVLMRRFSLPSQRTTR